MFKKGNVFEEQERNGWIYRYFMPICDYSTESESTGEKRTFRSLNCPDDQDSISPR